MVFRYDTVAVSPCGRYLDCVAGAVSTLRRLVVTLIQALEFGWEGYVFFGSGATSLDAIMFFSHDGWLEMMSDKHLDVR